MDGYVRLGAGGRRASSARGQPCTYSRIFGEENAVGQRPRPRRRRRTQGSPLKNGGRRGRRGRRAHESRGRPAPVPQDRGAADPELLGRLAVAGRCKQRRARAGAGGLRRGGRDGPRHADGAPLPEPERHRRGRDAASESERAVPARDDDGARRARAAPASGIERRLSGGGRGLSFNTAWESEGSDAGARGQEHAPHGARGLARRYRRPSGNLARWS